MKRSSFKIKPRKAMKRSGFKSLSRGLGRSLGTLKRKSKLRVACKSTTSSEIKRDIQDLLRELVIKRDKKCVLHGKRCRHEVGVEGVVWQADHLIERSNSATYADSRLVVLICRNCHGWKHFKKSNHDQYNAMVKQTISPERVVLWEKCEAESWKPKRTDSLDWMLAKVALKQEIKELDHAQ